MPPGCPGPFCTPVPTSAQAEASQPLARPPDRFSSFQTPALRYPPAVRQPCTRVPGRAESPAGHRRYTHVRSIPGTSYRGSGRVGKAGGPCGNSGLGRVDRLPPTPEGIGDPGGRRCIDKAMMRSRDLHFRDTASLPPQDLWGLPRGLEGGKPAGLIQCQLPRQQVDRGRTEDAQLDPVEPFQVALTCSPITFPCPCAPPAAWPWSSPPSLPHPKCHQEHTRPASSASWELSSHLHSH